MFIIIFLLIFGKMSCGFVPEEVKIQLKGAFCDLRCTNKIAIDNCDCSTLTAELIEVKSPAIKIDWQCRDERILSFKWTFSLLDVLTAYVVEYRTYNSNLWFYSNTTQNNFIFLEELEENKEYQIRVTGVSVDGFIYGPSLSNIVKTLGKDDYPFEELESSSFDWDLELTNNKMFNAIITWKPNEDHLCTYKIILLSAEGRMSIYENKKNGDVFKINATDIKMGETYEMHLSGKSSLGETSSAEKVFRSPSCLETFKNLVDCAPLPPYNVSIAEDISMYYQPNFENLTYDVNITWSIPKYIPNYYIVEVLLPLEEPPEVLANITGGATNATFNNITLTSYYKVRIIAYSEGGQSTPIAIDGMLHPRIHHIIGSEGHKLEIMLGVVGCTLVIVFVVIIIFYRRYKNLQLSIEDKDDSSYNGTAIYKLSDNIADDEWRLNADDIEVEELLGEGAFGIVYKGIIIKLCNGNSIKEEVAIKMLKGDSSCNEIRQFEKEIEIMKSVGSHPHIVSLIGCCSKMGYWGPLLVVEFCEKGDLLTHLHALWTAVTATKFRGNYVNSIDTDFYNRSYDFQTNQFSQVPKNLLTYARQIAMGMEYLSVRRVVHRDLATRNVLMCDNGWVKVADFGLSRDIYQDSIYTKTGMGRLPMKWMAIESLTHQLYTSQSDVWSFGVVLWEIATLGRSPYLAIDQADFLKFLLDGNRLECPKNCGKRLYEIMMTCWHETPLERPTFTCLLKIIENLLETENDYLNLDI